MFQHVMQNSEAEMFSSTQILESLQHPVLVVDANSEKRWPRLFEQARGLDKWITAG